MCMTIKHPQKKVRALPKEFVAYKVVAKRNGGYYAPIMDTLFAIEKTNVARPLKTFEHTLGGKYKPYYHSFKTQAACNAVHALDKGWAFIKIKIKRKDVTCVGGYGYKGKTQYFTIISKEYSTDFEEYIPSTNGRKNSE